MYEEHRTHDGIRMLIGQMEDSHLLNTIKGYCDKIEQCTRIIKGQPTADSALIETLGIRRCNLRSPRKQSRREAPSKGNASNYAN
jgi:hypothetical protein